MCLGGLFELVNAMDTIESSLFLRVFKWCVVIIEEIHAFPLRRSAFMIPLKSIMSALAKIDMQGFVAHTSCNMRNMNKLPSFEMFIRSLEFVELPIYPSQKLENTLTFLETMASYYDDVKGFSLREAFAITLHSMLSSIVPKVSAEVYIPRWNKIFVKMLLRRTFRICEKQKHRASTLRLAVIVLCLCDKKTFQEKWDGLADAISSLVRVCNAHFSIGYRLMITRLYP